ncbi:MAG TPA: hypothetical protein HPP94_09525 [Desulfuromonadales bacterium]|nr:hypothetical protein [Desulfuromonadales bacterium]
MSKKTSKPPHSKEFLAIMEQASPNEAIRAITHARPLLVYWVSPEGEVIDAGNEHFANPPQGDKSVLSHPTHKGHLRGRAAFIGAALYITVYGDNKVDALSTKQVRLLKLSYARIFSTLRDKGVSEQVLATAHFIQEDGLDIEF